jgi:hypothetical protein
LVLVELVREAPTLALLEMDLLGKILLLVDTLHWVAVGAVPVVIQRPL